MRAQDVVCVDTGDITLWTSLCLRLTHGTMTTLPSNPDPEPSPNPDPTPDPTPDHTPDHTPDPNQARRPSPQSGSARWGTRCAQVSIAAWIVSG